MKHIKKLILLFLLVHSGYSFGQNSNLKKAKDYLEKGALDKAKMAIDKTVVHPETMDSTSAWLTHGDVYYALHSSSSSEYKSLAANPLKTSLESYKKANELDKTGKYSDKIERGISWIQNKALNRGISKYGSKQYSEAIDKFKLAEDAGKFLGKTDTLAIYNIGLASEMKGDYDQAIIQYQRCLDLEYGGSDMCSYIVYVLKKQEKHKEVADQLAKCRAKFPKDYDLIIMELNNYLLDGHYAKALINLNLALEIDSNNHNLYISKGYANEKLGNQNAAEESYLAALKIQPNNFNGNYNLGSLYINKGVEINNKANKVEDLSKADEMAKQAEELFRKALPYFEKANEVKPKNRGVLNALKMLYVRLGNTEKYIEIKKTLKEMDGY